MAKKRKRIQPKARRVPRFLLSWKHSRWNSPVEVICWTWSVYRAKQIASRLDWSGMFQIIDLDKSVASDWFNQGEPTFQPML